MSKSDENKKNILTSMKIKKVEASNVEFMGDMEEIDIPEPITAKSPERIVQTDYLPRGDIFGSAPIYSQPYIPATEQKKRKVAAVPHPGGKTFVPQLINDSEFIQPESSADKENLGIIKDKVNIYYTDSRTVVIAVAVDMKSPENNSNVAIRCTGSVSFGGYPYDHKTDSYYIQCCDHMNVGGFAVGLRLSLEGVGGWKIDMPIPSNILEKYFSPQQNEAIKAFKDKYAEPRYKVEYVQMKSAN